MIESLVLDDLIFEVRRSTRRKTVGVTVDRDGSLIIHTPANATREELATAVWLRRAWVYEKLIGKGLTRRGEREVRYAPGETHYYLGRAYRLRYATGGAPGLTLSGGWFMLPKDSRGDVRDLFVSWYTEHGTNWLTRRVEKYRARTGVEECSLEVRDLGYRWGSCGAAGLNFHWRVMLLPPSMIDYVIVHELVHLLEPHHTADYWDRVRRVLPDFRAREIWVAENGASF